MISKENLRLLVLLVSAARIAMEHDHLYYATQIWELAGEFIDGLWASVAEDVDEYTLPEGQTGRVPTC